MDTQKPQRERGTINNLAPKEDRRFAPHSPSPSPSSTTSPSHDFSFTIPLHPPLASPSNTIDLAPADDIFLHGHLLPLHVISNTHVSPRTSNTSVENFRFPLDRVESDLSLKCSAGDQNHKDYNITNKDRTKTKSLSSFFGFNKWRKGEKDEDRSKKKKVFDVGRLLKKYVSMVEPLFFSKGEKEKRDLRRRPYSFSGHSNPKERDKWAKRRAQFSAPASMRTSPTNSGHLLATSINFSSSDESTMEELQSAIQAAIAHCKNSIAAKEEKCKC
ncbi:BRI1 kinase inhibitor 1-like [Typha latifolia]|uniref:BRI1 kinase inhibitor 1-like n=1 Tax=Typha latifolia TaxID=4733 RepID=UPI003C2EF000